MSNQEILLRKIISGDIPDAEMEITYQHPELKTANLLKEEREVAEIY